MKKISFKLWRLSGSFHFYTKSWAYNVVRSSWDDTYYAVLNLGRFQVNVALDLRRR